MTVSAVEKVGVVTVLAGVLNGVVTVSAGELLV